MRTGWLIRPKALFLGLALLVLGIIIACGSSATSTAQPPAATAAVAPTAAPAPTTAPAATTVPKAQPTATTAPVAVAVVKPFGTLNIGYKELGLFNAHPKLTAGQQAIVDALRDAADPIAVEQLAARTSLPLSGLLADLTLLQIRGRVRREGAGVRLNRD